MTISEKNIYHFSQRFHRRLPQTDGFSCHFALNRLELLVILHNFKQIYCSHRELLMAKQRSFFVCAICTIWKIIYYAKCLDKLIFLRIIRRVERRKQAFFFSPFFQRLPSGSRDDSSRKGFHIKPPEGAGQTTSQTEPKKRFPTKRSFFVHCGKWDFASRWLER